mgnify:CR=1 FL=1
MVNHPPTTEELRAFKALLPTAWSHHSSSKWTQENPAAGQCGVTALVVHDLFGGTIKKTLWHSPAGDIWHFYNMINGARWDFTDSQFDDPLVYTDEQSNRDEALGDTNAAQYDHLTKAVARARNAPS